MTILRRWLLRASKATGDSHAADSARTGHGPAPRESQELSSASCGSTPVCLGPLGGTSDGDARRTPESRDSHYHESVMRELPKNIKRQLRELVALVYERELGRELQALAREFDAWKVNGIDAFELEKRVHQFHQGPARELYGRYADNPNVELIVAGAVEANTIERSEIPEEVLPYLSNAFAFFADANGRKA